MKWAIYFLVTAILVMSYQRMSWGLENKKDVPKYTIAISNLEANNCPTSLSRAATDMLAGKLFTVDFFILLERNQMDLIMREKGIQGVKFTNINEAARLGKLLSVQKMIVGSLSKLGNRYRLEVRVVNVADGSVDLSTTDDARGEGDLEKAVTAISVKIERYYLGYAVLTGIADIAVNGSVVHSFGSLSQGTGFGYGCNVKAYWNRPFGWPVPFILSAGFHAFPPTSKSVKSFYMMPVELFVGYKFDLAKNVKLLPRVGGGYILSWIEHDPVKRSITSPVYTKDFYYNPAVSIGVELNIFVHDRIMILFTPLYTVFFENKNIGHFAGSDIGLKILF